MWTFCDSRNILKIWPHFLNEKYKVKILNFVYFYPRDDMTPRSNNRFFCLVGETKKRVLLLNI